MRRLLQIPWFGPLLALSLVYVVFATLRPDTFLGSTNLIMMGRQTLVVAVAAVGMTLVIMLGGIDLSVGSIVALTTVVIASGLRSGTDPVAAAALGMAIAAAAGLLNGALVTGLRIAPFIVTLGTMSVLRGVAKGLADEQKIDADPSGLDRLMSASGTIAPGVWLAAGVALLGAAMLHYTRLGRHLVAIGSNERAARLCGVAVGRVKLLVYGLSGLLAGVAGLLEFATLTVGDPTDSIGLELEVIASVVIGGGSLAGGQGSIAGTLVGALLMTVIKTGSTHLGLPNWVQEIATGAIIVAAMAVDRLRQGRRPAEP
jgi:ribose transport system permease protein